jgi:hypothetical protein
LQAGTGISIAHGNGSSQDPIITNSAPDQTVALTGGGATSISGTYPNFTISSVNTTYGAATSTVPGLIELGSDTAQTVAANAVSATASRSYALQVNAAGQGVVNVPWTDTNSGGTVTSVSGTGTASGLSLSGTVTTSGNLTLSGTVNSLAAGTYAISISGNAATATNVAYSGLTGTVPTWNQNTTGTAANVTGTVAVGNGGTGATTAAAARTNLGATTLGANVFTVPNVAAIRFPQFNADNTVSTLDAASFRTAIGEGTGSGNGTVTSVAVSGGTTGLTTSGGPITTSGTITLAGTLALANGGTGATTAAAARTNLGGTTLGGNLFTLANVAAIAFPRFNADNTVSSLNAASFRTAIGAGTSSTTGTVTSVGGTGTVSGLTLTGTVTTSGNLTLGGTLAVTPSNFASQTAKTVLAAPNAAAGVPTFRLLVASDIPTLNQNTTGTAANVTGTVAVANGGTGATTAAAARTNLGAMQNNAPAFSAVFTGTSVFSATNTEMGTSSENFDTASAYSTTNGRFTPQVAGYYQVNASVSAGPSGVGGLGVQILKNSSGTVNNAFFGTGDTTEYKAISTSGMVFLNGSTDYVSVYAYVSSGSMTATGYFSGALIRSNA